MYCTLDQAKAYIDIAAAVKDDALITVLIQRATAIIDQQTGRTFAASVDSTRYFDALDDVYTPDGDPVGSRRALYLGAHDLCQITTITNGDNTTVTAAQYVTQPRNSAPYFAIVLKRDPGVTWTYGVTPENAIAITGRWAYSIEPPADIVHACARLTGYLYKQKDTLQTFDRVMVAANGTVNMPNRMPSDVNDVLRAYRRLTP